MSIAERPGLRILVGAASFTDAASALHIIEHLPRRLCAGLGGVLIDEGALLATCQLPDQRIILLSGATTLAPTLSQLRTLVKADARAFKQSLAHTADPSGTDWVFAQDQGELIGTALRAAAGWDVLVLGYRQLHNVPGKIVLLKTDQPSSDAMREVSEYLSGQFNAECVTLSVGAPSGDIHPSRSDRTHQFATFGASLQALRRMNARAVMIDLGRGPVKHRQDLARLLEAARCPVIVFGASNPQALLEHSTHMPPSPDDAEPHNGD